LNRFAVTGIAVGAALAIAAMLHFQIFSMQEKQPYRTVIIDGLKGTYKPGEKIDFTVRVEGYGCDAGFPNVSIRMSVAEGQDRVVWSRFGEIKLLPAGVQCPSTTIYQVRYIGDVQKYNNDEQERLRTDGAVPIAMEKEGRYAVEVEGGNAGEGTSREFVVKG
jgi:hypothetical protein